MWKYLYNDLEQVHIVTSVYLLVEIELWTRQVALNQRENDCLKKNVKGKLTQKKKTKRKDNFIVFLL